MKHRKITSRRCCGLKPFDKIPGEDCLIDAVLEAVDDSFNRINQRRSEQVGLRFNSVV